MASGGLLVPYQQPGPARLIASFYSLALFETNARQGGVKLRLHFNLKWFFTIEIFRCKSVSAAAL